MGDEDGDFGEISGVHAPNWVRGAALWLACALLETGCASAVAIRVPEAGSQSTCVTPAPEPEIVLGVAISGGGSRAAVYGRPASRRSPVSHTPEGGSLQEKVTHLSSVSGGSLAASYYALHKPPRETPILGSGGA